MKVLPFNIPKTESESFRVQVDRMPHFYDILHRHPEIQITAILSGKGQRFIGDQIGSFQPGDILVIGPNIPHLLKCDEAYYQNQPTLFAHSISIFFNQNSLGNDFFSLPEMNLVREFIQKSACGLIISQLESGNIFDKIIEIKEKEGIDKVIGFLEILKLLSQIKAQQFLSPLPFYTSNREEDGSRLNDVIQFMIKNYPKNISLEEISEIAHLSPAAFCRFFKLRTRKTFITFLNELRISHACKLLTESEQPVNEICYHTGFNNLAHFNRLFKIQTGVTPSLYRKKAFL